MTTNKNSKKRSADSDPAPRKLPRVSAKTEGEELRARLSSANGRIAAGEASRRDSIYRLVAAGQEPLARAIAPAHVDAAVEVYAAALRESQAQAAQAAGSMDLDERLPEPQAPLGAEVKVDAGAQDMPPHQSTPQAPLSAGEKMDVDGGEGVPATQSNDSKHKESAYVESSNYVCLNKWAWYGKCLKEGKGCPYKHEWSDEAVLSAKLQKQERKGKLPQMTMVMISDLKASGRYAQLFNERQEQENARSVQE